MPGHLLRHLEKGRHIPGILELNPNMSFAETLEEFILIWGASEPQEYQDLIIYESSSLDSEFMSVQLTSLENDV